MPLPRLAVLFSLALGSLVLGACDSAPDAEPADARDTLADPPTAGDTLADPAVGQGPASGPVTVGAPAWTRVAEHVAPGREPAVLRLPDGSLAVGWVEAANGALDLRIRRIAPDGSLGGEALAVVRGWARLQAPELLLVGGRVAAVFAGSEASGGPGLPVRVAGGSLERGFDPPRSLAGPPADGRPAGALDFRGVPVVGWPSEGRAVVRFGFDDERAFQVLDAPCCPEHLAVAAAKGGDLQMAWASTDPGSPGLFTRALGAEFEPNDELPYSVLPGGRIEPPAQRVAMTTDRSHDRIVTAYCSVPECEAIYLTTGGGVEPAEVARAPGAGHVAASPAPAGVWVGWLHDAAVHAVTVRDLARHERAGSAGQDPPVLTPVTGARLEAPLPSGGGEPVALAIEGSTGPLDVLLVTESAGAAVLWHRRLSSDDSTATAPSNPGDPS